MRILTTGLLLVALAMPVYAESWTIKPINPVSGANQIVDPDAVFLPDLDGGGTIDEIRDDGIIISDTAYVLSPQIEYFNQYGKKTSPKDFKVGTEVVYVLDAQKRIQKMFVKLDD